MSEKQTFKEYLEAKARLREAVKSTPQRTAEYSVSKYTRIPVGESKDSKEYIPVKPKQKIIVEWLYLDVDNPTPVNLRFEGIEDIDPELEYSTFWSGSKLAKWLIRNAREESPL